MPKKAKELSAYQVRRLSGRPGKHAVGGVAGLLLEVKPSLTASWTFRVVIGNRRPDIGLGGYPDTTLERAREQAREIRAQIRQGIDPIAARRASQDALRAAHAKRLTFDEAAKRCHGTKSSEFRNAKHRKDWISSLELHASPVIGTLPVDQIELAHVVKVLEPIWTTRTETATRVRQRIESVLAWATVSGHRSGDNPARWKGNLEHALAKPSKVAKVEHMPALPWKTLPVFMADLRRREGMGTRCLEFAILTAARSNEVRLATWDEIDFKAKVWRVPAERMKAGKAHRVPLSVPAMKLLKALPRHEDSRYVFPAVRGGPLSDMALSATTRRMHEASVRAGAVGYLDPSCDRIVVPHGFRSTFRDWCAETTNYPREVAEQALAHAIENEVEAAYRRGELLEKRRQLMNAWAKYCGSTPRKASAAPTRGRQSRGSVVK